MNDKTQSNDKTESSDKTESDRTNPQADAPKGESGKTVVHRNDVKERHTTHWDIDVMSDDELDAMYRRNRRKQRLEDLGGWARILGWVTLAVWIVLAIVWFMTR